MNQALRGGMTSRQMKSQHASKSRWALALLLAATLSPTHGVASGPIDLTDNKPLTNLSASMSPVQVKGPSAVQGTTLVHLEFAVSYSDIVGQWCVVMMMCVRQRSWPNTHHRAALLQRVRVPVR